MDGELGPLLPLFERERAAGRAMALGILVHTAGSTYRKPGAMLLIAGDGRYAGLISGGCLEGDLGERARAVIETGRAALVTYDLRNPDDLVWGLGLGCEGAMHILLLRVGPQEEWQPLAHLAAALGALRRTAVAIVTESLDPGVPAGALLLPPGAEASAPDVPPPLPRSLPAGAGRALLEPRTLAALAAAPSAGAVQLLEGPGERCKLLLLPLCLPPRLLLLGAGPDALPVVDFAARLHWRVTLADHRQAYAVPAHFPLADSVLLTRPEDITRDLDLGQFTAAVVMSHHLPTDLEYLRALGASSIPYIGLLGPPARREKLLSELGTEAERLRPRLRAPVGFNLGGRTPESIALAIVAEVHAFVHGMQRPRNES
ncbi:MAG TPA: XdhC family protein [Steroidobacteraceae bacterium]|jgi:xanthine/CO dehydrogenase XdhC/CoxF family maturation factor|nr:XdhC family protein [Steroidobacteraceae bacterium]